MRRWLRPCLAPLAFVATTVVIVPVWSSRDARQLDVDGAPARALAQTVAERAWDDTAQVGPGAARFDGEWRTVTCAFGALGMAQVAERHPSDRAELLSASRACLKALQQPEARGFAETAWGVDGGTDLRHPGGHAWLAYEGLALAINHRAFPEDAWIAERHAKVHQALVRRMQHHSPATLQTYPGETYPPDQAVWIAAVEIGGHDTSAWRARWRKVAFDPATGLLVQRLDPATGRRTDIARGSGTLLAAWALGLADLEEGAQLWSAAREHLLVRGAGFAAMREVPSGSPFRMDVDSGPVILGLGLSSTGFALGASRTQHDLRTFSELHRVAWLVGAPGSFAGRRRWVGGGAVGDALMLAAESTPLGRQP